MILPPWHSLSLLALEYDRSGRDPKSPGRYGLALGEAADYRLQMTTRPTFFLSSTIYDFRDLRGAIKYTLEARGCRVLASEFNDFGGELDRHSYEACLANIERADYFILLIGSRVGGWYDHPNRISITQQEYRTAYTRHRAGLIKIITLVRAEVWQMREDRKALAHHLETLELADAERTAIHNYPSKSANDAIFISDFLTEVGRNAETGLAVKNGDAKPTGNWIHVFSGFRDVHDVLSPLAFSGQTADEAAYSQALQNELLTVLARLLSKRDGKPTEYSNSLKRHIERWPITVDDRFEDDFAIDAEAWQSFSSIMIHTLGGPLNTVVIEDALTSSVFMAYDTETGRYRQTPSYAALARLVDEIRMYNVGASAEGHSVIFEFSPRQIGRRKGLIQIPSQKLMPLYGLAYRWINIVSLTKALIYHLSGHPFEAPDLMPMSPIVGMEERIAAENPSPSEVRTALGL